ncbi:tumor susceptibility gene 101 protein [Stylonychia lemnae]|uniref:Tumor susceptibility gene 101 protein n=1 Tax=Stylonychia lemnae TaxID=5949 RepID=A0A078B356_STYLE|nr:tumor susceptibility gene 101 protein [Stylonychia lemnae]|eukprot:CDW87918.1 tumor susceptibility gene 101 protein [Stylonychia lemnae]
MAILKFPGEIRQNFIVLKGAVQCQASPQPFNTFPLKIVIPQGFPFHPPRVFLDMQISIKLLQSKTYLGQMNAFKIPYLNSWTNSAQQKSNLVDLMGYIVGILTNDPPVEQGLNAAMMNNYGGSFPQQQVQPQPYQQQQQQQPYGQQNVAGQNYGAANYNFGGSQMTSQAEELLEKIDRYGGEYAANATQTLNKLIEAKVQLYENKRAIDDKLESLRQNSGMLEQNIAALNHHNQKLSQFVTEQGSSHEINEENINSYVYPSSAYSDKIIDLTAKESAFEDCLVALKKAYEKDQMNLQEFLKSIRQISNRQFKATLKRNKIVAALSNGMGQAVRS